MSPYKYFWKILLRKIPYEKEGNRYTAEVQTRKRPVDVDEIARQIMHEGSEIKYATLLNIINRYVLNTPARVMVRVPNGLVPGSYRLMIRTHFIRGGKQRSNELHTIVYSHPLTVDPPASPSGNASERET